MKKDITLVILAAGMGSRFGGLKQIEPLGPNGEFIIDYSVYDAIKAGFNKIVFLIKEENYYVFKETIGKRVEPYINVEYCFQKNDNIPNVVELPKDRVKPFGTAHAILCCKDKVNEPFMIINADDFYGTDSFMKSAEFLNKVDINSNNYGMVGYLVKNTITENGSVKRGVCEVKQDELLKLTESSVEKIDNKIIAKPLNGNDPYEITEDTTVSMNMLLFTPSIFNYIEKNFGPFLIDNKDNLDKCEYLIPDVLLKAIEEKYANAKVLSTTSNWYGVTYKEDVDNVKNALSNMVKTGVYPSDLWEIENKNKTKKLV